MEEVEIVWKDETAKTQGERHFRHLQTILNLSIISRNKGKTFNIYHKDTATMRSAVQGDLNRDMVKGFLLAWGNVGKENINNLYGWK